MDMPIISKQFISILSLLLFVGLWPLTVMALKIQPLNMQLLNMQLLNEQTGVLEWPLPGLWSHSHSGFIRFRASHLQRGLSYNHIYTHKEQVVDRRSFTLTGRKGQSFTVCGQPEGLDNFIRISSAISREPAHTLELTRETGSLTLSNLQPCPALFIEQLTYGSKSLRSDEPFLMISKNEKKNDDAKGGDSTGLQLPPVSLSDNNGWSGTDFDHFKRPPFIPWPDKAMASLLLLPFKIPDNWRDYLSLVNVYHWLTEQPILTEERTHDITLLIQFNDEHPSLSLQIPQAELAELANHLMSAQQLLRWLLPKLNGRETFIQQLLDVSASVAETSLLWDEVTINAIHHQLLMVLEQPDTEFSLTFEQHELSQALAHFSEAGIVYLPGEQGGNRAPVQLPQGAGSMSLFDEASSGHTDLPRQNFRDNRKGDDEPPSRQPPDSVQDEKASEQNFEDNFTMLVNGIRFQVRECRLNAPNYGFINSEYVVGYFSEHPEIEIGLNEVELNTGLYEANRLKDTSSTADYFLAYGTDKTKFKTRGLIAQDEKRDWINGYSPLHRAARYGESLEAIRLIRNGANANAYTSNGECALHLAAKYNQAEFILKLCDPVCSLIPVDQKNKKEDKEAIHYAAESGHAEAVRSLIQCGACLSPPDMIDTPLHLAAIKNHAWTVSELIDKGVDPRESPGFGITALHRAVEHGSTEVVALLLYGYKVDPNAKGCSSLSPLCLAIEKNDSVIIDMLVECKADHLLSLESAIRWDRFNIFNKLLSMEGVTDKCKQDNDLISLAYILNRREMVNVLIDIGADVMFRNNEGDTLLHRVSAEGQREIVILLLANGAKTNESNVRKQTPIYLAYVNQHWKVAELLLKHVAFHKECDFSDCIAQASKFDQQVLSLPSCRLDPASNRKHIAELLEKRRTELPSLHKLALWTLFREVGCKVEHLFHLYRLGQLSRINLLSMLRQLGFEELFPEEIKKLQGE